MSTNPHMATIIHESGALPYSWEKITTAYIRPGRAQANDNTQDNTKNAKHHRRRSGVSTRARTITELCSTSLRGG
jgi:hypothetical protein